MENMQGKLIDNLAEVDKSLRRSYLVQTIICLLFFYFSYNSIMVADQKKDIDIKVKDVKCAEDDYAQAITIISELANPDNCHYDWWVTNLNELADEIERDKEEQPPRRQLAEQQSYDTGYSLTGIAPLFKKNAVTTFKKNADMIHKALSVARAHNAKTVFSTLTIMELTTLLESLLPTSTAALRKLEPFINKKFPDKKKSDLCRRSLKGKEVFEFKEVLPKDLVFFKNTCDSSLDIIDRVDLLARVKRHIIESGNVDTIEYEDLKTIEYEDLKTFEKILKEKKRKLTETSIGAIKIPFTGQPLEINLAFRLGPIVMLLLQIFISAYFRHRFELISMLHSTFDQRDSKDKKIKERIHLFLWPWILNYPYFRAHTVKMKQQCGDVITKTLILTAQFLPVFTIAFIAIRPIIFGWAGNTMGSEIAFGDVFWMSTYIILLFLTMRQILYARHLDTMISDILGWRSVSPIKAVVVKPTSRLRHETLFLLLTLGALLLNFNIYHLGYFSLSFEVIPPLLIIITGLKYTKLRTNILTSIFTGFWLMIAFLLIISRDVYLTDFFRFGLRLDSIGFPHSSITALIHLLLVGYFTVLLRQKIQFLLSETGISREQIFLPTPEGSTNGFRKAFCFIVVVLVILGANILHQSFPSGLALLACCMGGCWLGPKLGALSGGVVVFLSMILRPVLHQLIPDFRVEYYEIGQIVTFALTGYLAGKIWMLIKRPATLKEIGAKLFLYPANGHTGKWFPFAFLVFMFALVSSLYLEIDSPFVSLRFLLDPLPKIIVILLGVFYGHRKASWSTGIILCLATLMTTTAIYFEINTYFEMSLIEGSVLKIGLYQWSFPGIAVCVLAAYMAGKINLAGDRKHLFWFSFAVFIGFQIPGFIKYGSILSALTFRGYIGWFDIRLITSLVQLLEPWAVALTAGFFIKNVAGNKSGLDLTSGE